MKTILLAALLLSACQITYSQVAPAASAGKATLRYAIRYSEMAEFGGTLGNWHTITPSASLIYSNGRTRFPFNLEYAGGYTSTLSGPSYSTGAFQHLLLSQGLNYHRWDLAITDDVGYRPQSPTTGFSGIPGIGEPIGTENVGAPSQTILTLNTYALENVAQGQLRHTLNHRSTLNIESSHDYLHYPDGNGLDTSSIIMGGGFDFRFNSRNSLTTQYLFSRFTFSGYDILLTTNTIMFGFYRAWTRSLQTDVSAGPEWVTNSRSTITPPSTGVSIHAGLSYDLGRTTTSLSYFRGTSGGSGYMVGSQSDTVSAGFARGFNKSVTFELSGGYSHNSPLVRTGKISNVYGGVQTSWRIRRNLNAFVNYTATSQNSGMRMPSNVQSVVVQTISCGIGFTRGTKRSR